MTIIYSVHVRGFKKISDADIFYMTWNQHHARDIADAIGGSVSYKSTTDGAISVLSNIEHNQSICKKCGAYMLWSNRIQHYICSNLDLTHLDMAIGKSADYASFISMMEREGKL